MPFDPIGFEDIAVPTVKPFDFDTATPDERLLELARLLENEQEWRDTKMEWNYWTEEGFSPHCGTSGCAMGLALVSWPAYRKMHDRDAVCERAAFGITTAEGDWLFYGDAFGDAVEITPGMVATAIREFVANRQAA